MGAYLNVVDNRHRSLLFDVIIYRVVLPSQLESSPLLLFSIRISDPWIAAQAAGHTLNLSLSKNDASSC